MAWFWTDNKLLNKQMVTVFPKVYMHHDLVQLLYKIGGELNYNQMERYHFQQA